jgi:hypothetical protein
MSFADARLGSSATFDEARLGARGNFEKAIFNGRASFDRVSTRGQRSVPGEWLEFRGARFGDRVSFAGAQVAGIIADRATFAAGLDINDAVVDYASVKYAEFGGPVWLHGSLFDSLVAEHARFAGAGSMGDIVVTKTAWLDWVVADTPFELRIDASLVSLEHAELRRGGRLGVRRALPPTLVVLDHLGCGAPFTTAAIPQLDSDAERQRVEAEEHRAASLRDSRNASRTVGQPAPDEPEEPGALRRLREAAARLDPVLAATADTRGLDPQLAAHVIAVRARDRPPEAHREPALRAGLIVTDA